MAATTTASGLQYEDERVGTGPMPQAGQMVAVNYTVKLMNGTVVDSSLDPKFHHVEPFVYEHGDRGLIKGWNEGVSTMQVGGIRTLIVPPNLAYGSAGSPPVIPPNSTLIFEIELLSAK